MLHNSEGVTGEKIFSFANMKRKIGMIEKATEIQNQLPKTPARMRNKLTKGKCCWFFCHFCVDTSFFLVMGWNTFHKA